MNAVAPIKQDSLVRTINEPNAFAIEKKHGDDYKIIVLTGPEADQVMSDLMDWFGIVLGDKAS